MFKNVASQFVIVYAWDSAAGEHKSGDAAQITGRVSKDSIDSAATNDVNPTEIANAPGQYAFLMTQAETNCDLLGVAASSSTADIDLQPVIIYTIQVDNIGAASGGTVNIPISEDNTGGAIDPSSAVFVGSVQGATTFANLEAADDVVHDIDDVGNDIDIVYGCAVGGGRTASEVSILANVSGNADEIKVKAFDHVGSDWEIIGTIEGSGGSTFKALDLPLLLKHTGTGTELGKVYIRFETDSTTPSNLSVDRLLVRAVNIGQSVGYANGRIWVDTVNGTAGTEPFVNGVADNPVNLIASAKTLSTSVGVPDFHIINGSTITLAESTVNESYFGDNWTLALGGQDVDGAYFQGAHVTGVGTSATEVHYEGCDIGTMSVQIGHFDFCAFGGTVTQTLAGDYEYHNCYSNVAGAGAPTFTKTAGQAITAEWRNWMDSITVSGLEAGDVVTINGRLGTVTLNGADASVEIRGSYKSIVNNLTGSPTVNLDGAWKGADVADIFIRTGYAQNAIWIDTVNGAAGTTDYTHGVESNPVNSIADANTLATSLGITRFIVASGSSITFAAAQTGQCFTGDGWTLALGGQDVSNSIFIGATVSGVMAGTGVLQKFYNCVVNATSVIKGTVFYDSLIANTITVVEAGEFMFKACVSSVAGAGAPTFDFGSGLNSSNLSVRQHSGGWTIENMGAGTGTYNASFEGNGQIIWAASCSATSNASIRGNWKITDNASGAVTETLDDNQAGVDDLNLGIIYGVAQTGTLSTTACTTDLTGFLDGELVGGVIVFTAGGVADGQRAAITGYTAASGLVTFSAGITTAPANNDPFKIV